MNTPTIAVGLDIGTTKIAVLVGQLDSYRKLEILGYGTAPSLGVQRGVVVNITQTIESIKQAIEAAKLDCGLDITGVVVGIAGQHIRSLQHSDYITRTDSEEVIGDRDLERLIENVHKLSMMPGEEIIHVIPQEYKVDGQGDIKEPRGMYGACPLSWSVASRTAVMPGTRPIRMASHAVKRAASLRAVTKEDHRLRSSPTGARRSAAKSDKVTSVSCPTPTTIGVLHAATARTTASTLKHHRSSRLPPPRQSTSAW